MEDGFSQAVPVDGGYGPWSEWSDCSVSCGPGMRQRIRICDSPAPENDGRPCKEAEGTELDSCLNEQVMTISFYVCFVGASKPYLSQNPIVQSEGGALLGM